MSKKTKDSSGFDISDIKALYNYDWGINDFVVSDEQNLVVTNKARRIDGYSIGICLRGTITIEINHNTYEGTKNSMMISNPHQFFRFVKSSKDCLLRFIVFSKRFLVANNINQQILDKFQFTYPDALPVIQLKSEEAVDIVRQFEIIWKKFKNEDHPFRREVVGSQLLSLLYEFEAIYRRYFKLLQTSGSRTKELSRKFAELATKHFMQQRYVEFYAKKLFVSTKYLTRAVKEVTGKTPGAFIAELVCIEAQTLLQQPGVSIKEVAAYLNFPDQSTFGKFFKRVYGESPVSYKNNHSIV